MPIDIRTDGGIEVIPNSVTEDGRYEWLQSGLRPISELPYGNIGWTRTRVRRGAQSAVEEPCEGGDILLRGQCYIDKFSDRAVTVNWRSDVSKAA